jgi:hypothetical protein
MTLTLATGKTIEVEIEEPEHFTPGERVEVARVMIQRWRTWAKRDLKHEADMARRAIAIEARVCLNHKQRETTDGRRYCDACRAQRSVTMKRRRRVLQGLPLDTPSPPKKGRPLVSMLCPDGFHDLSGREVCACGRMRVKVRKALPA